MTVVSCYLCSMQESGTRLFACCGDNKVYLWDLESGSHLVSGHYMLLTKDNICDS